MTIFELVKLVLDGLYVDGHNQYGAGLDDVIKTQMSYLTSSYSNLSSTDRKPINYSDPAIRFAYVFKYVASHGDCIVQFLQTSRKELGGKLFSSETLRLTCIGGGPGSDVVGVLKYLSDFEDEPVKKITCYLLDREQAWADTWTEIGDSLHAAASLNLNFQRLDVTDATSWQSQRKFLQADLFTLSYFVSEVKSLDNGDVAAFWQTLFDNAKVGALFLYLDNGSQIFNDYFDEQWKPRSDIECIFSDDNTYKTPRFSEQASDLAEFRTKFGQSPKLKTCISLRLLRKK